MALQVLLEISPMSLISEQNKSVSQGKEDYLYKINRRIKACQDSWQCSKLYKIVTWYKIFLHKINVIQLRIAEPFSNCSFLQ